MALQTIAQAWSSAEPEVDARTRAAGLDHAEAGELARWSAFARWICGPATPATFPQPQLSGAVTPSVSPFLVSARQPVTAGGGSARFASRIAVKALSPSWRNTLKNSFANSASAAVGSAAGSTVELQNGLVSAASGTGLSAGPFTGFGAAPPSFGIPAGSATGLPAAAPPFGAGFQVSGGFGGGAFGQTAPGGFGGTAFGAPAVSPQTGNKTGSQRRKK